jgi:hypothetical protein
MPVYWKPRYATRSMRHRAWVKRAQAREEALRRARPASLWRRLIARFHRES